MVDKPRFLPEPLPPTRPVWAQLMPFVGTLLAAGLISYLTTLPGWLCVLLIVTVFILLWVYSKRFQTG